MKALALVLVVAAGLAGPSIAQAGDPPFPLSHPPVRMGDPTVQTFSSNKLRQMTTKRRQQFMQEIADKETWERVDRALRVAALVDGGHCVQAEELAESEKDHAMAMRARFLCENNSWDR